MTVILAFSVFMLAIAERMPETSESIPLIGNVFCCKFLAVFDSEEIYQTKTRNMEFSLWISKMMSAVQTIAISLLLQLESECSRLIIIHYSPQDQIKSDSM